MSCSPHNVIQSTNINSTMKFQVLISIVIFLSAATLSHQANLKVCHQRRATILSDRNGNYLKQVCQVRGLKNYANAQEFCRTNGMELLVIENQEVFNAFSSYVMSTIIPTVQHWKDGHGTWINGMRDINGFWHTFAPSQRPLNTDALQWTSGPNYGGECLTAKRDIQIKVAGFRCEKPYWFLCQFDVDATLNINFKTTTNQPLSVINVPSTSPSSAGNDSKKIQSLQKELESCQHTLASISQTDNCDDVMDKLEKREKLIGRLNNELTELKSSCLD